MRLAGLCLLFLAARGLAVEPIVKIDRIETDRVMSAGFNIEKESDFKIKAVGLQGSHAEDFVAYGWLLDSATRKPIWTMERQNTRRKGNNGLREANESIKLKAGKYELYYYAGSNWIGEINIDRHNVFEFLGDIFDGRLHRDVEDHLDEFYVAVYPARDGFKNYTLFAPDGVFSDALFQFNKVGDSQYLQQGFTLDEPMTIHVYGLCEFPSGYKYPIDHAWIINAGTRTKAWEMDRWNTNPAGGGRKNRVVDQDVKLDKGSYILIYVTDDSHSFDDFNVMPPYDPYNWGVAILLTAETNRSAVHLFKPKGRGEPLIALTRVGDDESISQPFKLDKDMSLKILCLGEYSEWASEFADYGWIENASTGKTVWELTYRNTEHAGGARKNRMFDATINLPKGTYVARYISDDSHSYRHWNDAAPYDAEAWGLSIYPGDDFDESKFHPVNEAELQKSANVLAKMTGLGDSVRKRAKFTLDKRTKIHIYAIGEGGPDGMMDFGWIVNDQTDKTVWEMTWRNTEPAGGASKNRMYDDSVILDPGTFEVYFITDGSHSFNSWNAAKPRDPSNWGITVTIDKNGKG